MEEAQESSISNIEMTKSEKDLKKPLEGISQSAKVEKGNTQILKTHKTDSPTQLNSKTTDTSFGHHNIGDHL